MDAGMTMYLIQFEMCKIDPTLIYALCMRVSDSKVVNYFNVLKIAFFFDRSKYYI